MANQHPTASQALGGLKPLAWLLALLFPALIGLSCLFTKQHYLIDVPAGAALGWADYSQYARLIAA